MPECGLDEFQCLDETCILLSYMCDGKDDCANGEDEMGCPSTTTPTTITTTTVSENEGLVYCCQIKQEECQFATVAPVYYTQCKNDDTICSGGGGESDPCEGDSPDPEEMKFCTAKMPEISDLTDAQKPWVLCSDECFVGCK